MPTSNPRQRFYKEVEIDSNIYPADPQFDFGFRASIVIITRSDQDKDFLYWAEDTKCTVADSNIIDGKLEETDGPFTLDDCDVRKLWFRTHKQGQKITVRVWARANIS